MPGRGGGRGGRGGGGGGRGGGGGGHGHGEHHEHSAPRQPGSSHHEDHHESAPRKDAPTRRGGHDDEHHEGTKRREESHSRTPNRTPQTRPRFWGLFPYLLWPRRRYYQPMPGGREEYGGNAEVYENSYDEQAPLVSFAIFGLCLCMLAFRNQQGARNTHAV